MTLFSRAKQIYQTEGGIALFRRACTFVAYSLFEYRTYYLWGNDVEDVRSSNEADFMPKVDNFTLKIISTNQEADELEAGGLEFRSHVPNGRERLDKGAVAFCIFIGRELANIVWVAMTQQAKDSLNQPPFKVDFSNNESLSAGSWSSPKYRRKGLQVYNNLKRFEYLLDKAVVVDWGALEKGNIGAQKANTEFGGKIYAEGRHLRILWWKSWKETPLPLD
ncbi:MAG: hypothetical protein WBC82_02995 [Dehalococcoidia bacterium]